MAYLLMGYDTENYLDPSLGRDLDWDVTLRFLSQVRRVHEELDAPCSLFICGRLLEEPDVLEALQTLAQSRLFDLQQHTYSHQRLKTVAENNGEKITVYEGASLETIHREVARADNLFKEKLNIHCLGITGPYGYYRGLMDRPDILEILYEAGIRFTRTYIRDENDWQPLSIEAQPFTYKPQGFPEMLEIPGHGWHDALYFRLHGWDKREEFLSFNKGIVDEIIARDLAWSVCQHDWVSCEKDPEMQYTRKLISYAQSKGVTLASHRMYYEKVMGIPSR